MRDLRRSLLAAMLFGTFINGLNDGVEVMLAHFADSLDEWVGI